MELPRKTYQDIMDLEPCFDPAERGQCTSDWEGTALDILRASQVSVEDRLWVVMRADWLPAPIWAEADAKTAPIRAEAHAKIASIRAEADAKIASIRAEADAKIASIWAEADAKIASIWAEADAQIASIWAEADAKIVNWLIDALTAYGSAATEGETS